MELTLESVMAVTLEAALKHNAIFTPGVSGLEEEDEVLDAVSFFSKQLCWLLLLSSNLGNFRVSEVRSVISRIPYSVCDSLKKLNSENVLLYGVRSCTVIICLNVKF